MTERRKQNRSSEELAMREAVAAWGRARWPSARVVHELVCRECRIDMAFISANHLAGIEIKSSKDKLDRLEKQLFTFTRYLPEVWLAIEPKWGEDAPYGSPRLTVDLATNKIEVWGQWYKPDRSITAQMLHLLWRDELAAIAGRKRIDQSKRATIGFLLPLLARKLTGDEIVEEVCRELRGRAAFAAESDPPIWDEAPRRVPVVAVPQLELSASATDCPT